MNPLITESEIATLNAIITTIGSLILAENT
jgi:hypothetical protein